MNTNNTEVKKVRLIDADALANYANNQTVGITANEIMRFPTVDAEPVKHGYWVYDGCGNLVCSNCRWKFSDELLYMSRNLDAKTEEIIGYCMHCGAKMDGGVNNEV